MKSKIHTNNTIFFNNLGLEVNIVRVHLSMKKIALIPLFIIVLFQLSCVTYKEIYRSDSSQNKGYEIIDNLKVGDIVKVGLKNGSELLLTIIMLNEKEIYGSTKPVGEIFNKIIPFMDIEYLKIGEDATSEMSLKAVGFVVFIVVFFGALLSF